MAEPIETPYVVTDVPVEKTSRLKSFRINHPRTAKVVGIAAVTAATLGAVQVWKNRKHVVDETETETVDSELETSS